MKSALLAVSTGIALVLFHLNAAGTQSINLGGQAPAQADFFKVDPIAEFNRPWSLAVLPNGRFLVAEEPGHLFLVHQGGGKVEVKNLPTVDVSRDDGLLDVVPAPDFEESSIVFFTYIDPLDGRRLALARASLSFSNSEAALKDLEVIWRQKTPGGYGSTGGVLAFDPQGEHLYLSIGDFMEPGTAQNLEKDRGKVLRFNLAKGSDSSNGMIAEIWTTGHRNPYGLAFAPDGQLWLHEMGPRGGDELNLVIKGQNYGWPLVSEGSQYDGSKIPGHQTRPDFAPPHAYWSPVISPAGMSFYSGEMFPRWKGAALIGGLSSRSLTAVLFDGEGKPLSSERWDMGARIRDVATATDGSVYILEDGSSGRLVRLTPAR